MYKYAVCGRCGPTSFSHLLSYHTNSPTRFTLIAAILSSNLSLSLCLVSHRLSSVVCLAPYTLYLSSRIVRLHLLSSVLYPYPHHRSLSERSSVDRKFN